MATSNFNLPLISPTDPVNIVGDMNGLANAVDTALGSINGTAQQAKGDAASASQTASTASTNALQALTDAADAIADANDAKSEASAARSVANQAQTAAANANAAASSAQSVADSANVTASANAAKLVNVTNPKTLGNLTRQTLPGQNANYHYEIVNGLLIIGGVHNSGVVNVAPVTGDWFDIAYLPEGIRPQTGFAAGSVVGIGDYVMDSSRTIVRLIVTSDGNRLTLQGYRSIQIGSRGQLVGCVFPVEYDGQ